MAKNKSKWLLIAATTVFLFTLAISSYADTKAPETFNGSILIYVYNADGSVPIGTTIAGVQENGFYYDTWLIKADGSDTSRTENVFTEGFYYNVEDFGGGYYAGTILFDILNFKMWNGSIWENYEPGNGDIIYIQATDMEDPNAGECWGGECLCLPWSYTVTGNITAGTFWMDTLCLPSAIGEYDKKLPQNYSLNQNHPNPFNASTIIEYALPEAADVQISITNILGEQIKTLVNKNEDAGYKRILWDGTDDSNNRVATGVYFYRIKANDFEARKRMVLIK
ncbi:T9SS type A sorting domain-containing protein [bacterium]|nr:T9SS type A sorting domain-containing protein [bacterium]